MNIEHDFDKMIWDAISKDEVVTLLRGEGEYRVFLPSFAVFSSINIDITSLLVECFYKQYGKIPFIEDIFHDAMVELISGTIEDLYYAVEYFNKCIFQEEEGKATFKIRKDEIADLISNAIEKNWAELKYGEKFFDMHLVYAWNKDYQEKYDINIAPELEKMAKRTIFESNETTIYYENLIKKAIENNEVMDLLRGEGEYKFRIAQCTHIELIRETSTRLACCFYMQMGRIEGIDNIFYESIKKLYLGNASDVFWAELYYDEHLYYKKKEATFYIYYKEFYDIIRESYNKYRQELQDGIELCEGVKVKIPWVEVEKWNSELMKNCAFKFNCHYVPED